MLGLRTYRIIVLSTHPFKVEIIRSVLVVVLHQENMKVCVRNMHYGELVHGISAAAAKARNQSKILATHTVRKLRALAPLKHSCVVFDKGS